MRYYIKAFKNYFNADGRASRKEFWLFVLFHILIAVSLSFLDGFFGFYSTKIPLDYGYMTLAYLFLSAPPTICVQIRRLHDVNKSGNWWWVSNAPIISLYVLYLYLKRGDPVSNRYGSPSIPQRYATSSTTPQATEPVQPQLDAPVQTSNTQPPIRFCRKCGFELIAGSEFCSKCGTAVVKE